MEIEIGDITAYDNVNGQGILATVEFKDYDKPAEDIIVQVKLPLDKNASLNDVEKLALEEAKRKVKALASSL